MADEQALGFEAAEKRVKRAFVDLEASFGEVFAERVTIMLGAKLGKNGKEHAKENFLITVNLKRWLLLFQILLGMARPNATALGI